jgi:hypothetical protein
VEVLLLGTWGPPIMALCRQYPWQVFAFVLVTALVVFDLTRRNRSSAGDDFGGFDFGDGDGCGE